MHQPNGGGTAKGLSLDLQHPLPCTEAPSGKLGCFMTSAEEFPWITLDNFDLESYSESDGISKVYDMSSQPCQDFHSRKPNS